MQEGQLSKQSQCEFKPIYCKVAPLELRNEKNSKVFFNSVRFCSTKLEPFRAQLTLAAANTQFKWADLVDGGGSTNWKSEPEKHPYPYGRVSLTVFPTNKGYSYVLVRCLHAQYGCFYHRTPACSGWRGGNQYFTMLSLPQQCHLFNINNF